jgi:hypothetical protein
MARAKSVKNDKKKPIDQYDHKGKKRANNPPVGLVTPETDPPDPPKKNYAYDPHLDLQLVWAGKAERMSVEVPTVSLHVHERIDPRTIIEGLRKRNGRSAGLQTGTAPTVRSISETFDAGAGLAPPSAGHVDACGSPARDQMTRAGQAPPLQAVARSGETLRQSEWRDVLLKGGVRGKGGQTTDFARVEALGGTRWLHADAETKGVTPERVVISFEPEYAPLEQRQVELAWEEARQLSPKPSILLFVYTDIDPEAGKDIAELTPGKAG